MTGSCSIHGQQDVWATTCIAIGEALNEGKAIGFIWGGEGKEFWAVCPQCDADFNKNQKPVHESIRLCGKCFFEAWELNGKPEKSS